MFQLGRCIAATQSISCTNVEDGALVHIYHQIIDGKVLPRELAHNGQTLAKFPERPPQSFFNAALLHPIKHPDEMALFHHQTLHHLRPILPAIKAPKHNAPKHHHHLFKNAMIHIHKSCVNNVVFQTQRSNAVHTECKPPAVETPIRLPIVIHVVHTAAVRISNTLTPDISQTITLVSAPVDEEMFRQSSQKALRNTVRQLIIDADKNRRSYIAFATQDVMLHCGFAQRFVQLWNQSRCAAHMFTEHFGGVLLLGAREWSEKSWSLIVADIQRGRHGSASNEQCYNIGMSTFGSFAVVLSRSVFTDALAWFEQTNNTQPLFSLVTSLADVGYIVRSAFPYLAIQDMASPPVFEGGELEQQAGVTTSSTRSKVHKWVQQSYCHRLTEPVTIKR